MNPSSANLNLRIHRRSHAMLKQIADHLGIKLNTVVASILEWALLSREGRDEWMHGVNQIRKIVEETDQTQPLRVYDFSVGEWPQKLADYNKLRDIGLIEALAFRHSGPGRVICSFLLTTTACVIATILDKNAPLNNVVVDHIAHIDDEDEVVVS